MTHPTGDHRPNPIVAIMAKAPRPGHVKTRLLPALSPQDAARLHRAFLEDTVDRVLSLAGVQAAVVCPPDDCEPLRSCLQPGAPVLAQGGEGLAAGLESALARLDADGYTPILLLDSDTPHLPAQVLYRAVAALEQVDLVAGPTDDGGYYLVGTRRHQPGLFQASSMGTGTALDALLSRACDLGLRVSLLPRWFDVDTPDDLTRLARFLRRYPEAAPRTAALLPRIGVPTAREWKLANAGASSP